MDGTLLDDVSEGKGRTGNCPALRVWFHTYADRTYSLVDNKDMARLELLLTPRLAPVWMGFATDACLQFITNCI
jgi:hypothetical protein